MKCCGRFMEGVEKGRDAFIVFEHVVLCSCWVTPRPDRKMFNSTGRTASTSASCCSLRLAAACVEFKVSLVKQWTLKQLYIHPNYPYVCLQCSSSSSPAVPARRRTTVINSRILDSSSRRYACGGHVTKASVNTKKAISSELVAHLM